MLQNGPGWSSDAITSRRSIIWKPGDVIIIPARHWALVHGDPRSASPTMMVRIDPDKVVPTKSQARSGSRS